jgi:hypothetical protein
MRLELGRRGILLACIGAVDCAQGLVALSTHDAAWSAVWLIAGLICLIQALMKFDFIGYAVAAGVKLAWATHFITLAIVGPDHLSSLGQGITWIVIGIYIVIAASWPEPADLKTLEIELPDFSHLGEPK